MLQGIFRSVSKFRSGHAPAFFTGAPLCWNSCDDWSIEVFDVEAAFLNATPGTTMHIGVWDDH